MFGALSILLLIVQHTNMLALSNIHNIYLLQQNYHAKMSTSQCTNSVSNTIIINGIADTVYAEDPLQTDCSHYIS